MPVIIGAARVIFSEPVCRRESSCAIHHEDITRPAFAFEVKTMRAFEEQWAVGPVMSGRREAACARLTIIKSREGDGEMMSVNVRCVNPTLLVKLSSRDLDGDLFLYC